MTRFVVDALQRHSHTVNHHRQLAAQQRAGVVNLEDILLARFDGGGAAPDRCRSGFAQCAIDHVASEHPIWVAKRASAVGARPVFGPAAMRIGAPGLWVVAGDRGEACRHGHYVVPVVGPIGVPGTGSEHAHCREASIACAQVTVGEQVRRDRDGPDRLIGIAVHIRLYGNEVAGTAQAIEHTVHRPLTAVVHQGCTDQLGVGAVVQADRAACRTRALDAAQGIGQAGHLNNAGACCVKDAGDHWRGLRHVVGDPLRGHRAEHAAAVDHFGGVDPVVVVAGGVRQRPLGAIDHGCTDQGAIGVQLDLFAGQQRCAQGARDQTTGTAIGRDPVGIAICCARVFGHAGEDHGGRQHVAKQDVDLVVGFLHSTTDIGQAGVQVEVARGIAELAAVDTEIGLASRACSRCEGGGVGRAIALEVAQRTPCGHHIGLCEISAGFAQSEGDGGALAVFQLELVAADAHGGDRRVQRQGFADWIGQVTGQVGHVGGDADRAVGPGADVGHLGARQGPCAACLHDGRHGLGLACAVGQDHGDHLARFGRAGARDDHILAFCRVDAVVAFQRGIDGQTWRHGALHRQHVCAERVGAAPVGGAGVDGVTRHHGGGAGLTAVVHQHGLQCGGAALVARHWHETHARGAGHKGGRAAIGAGRDVHPGTVGFLHLPHALEGVVAAVVVKQGDALHAGRGVHIREAAGKDRAGLANGVSACSDPGGHFCHADVVDGAVGLPSNPDVGCADGADRLIGCGGDGDSAVTDDPTGSAPIGDHVAIAHSEQFVHSAANDEATAQVEGVVEI